MYADYLFVCRQHYSDKGSQTMDFDKEVDQIKEEMKKTAPSLEELRDTNMQLRDRLAASIKSERIRFEYDEDEEDGPGIDVLYTKSPFHIGTINSYTNGGIVFTSDSEYFPPVAPFDGEEDLLKEAYEFLAMGLAAFELDEETEEIDV
jgi:phosphoribosyl 1,2-cyclic phosphodiesterase